MSAGRITPKGLAMVAAVESGLIQKDGTGDGYPLSEFTQFWNSFSEDLREQFGCDLNDVGGMEMDKELTIRERAMEWVSNLDAKFASMSDDEQCVWLTTTQDGRCYADIMNGSWREDWEDIVVEVYRERFGIEG